jgi:small-conductance mechanosensitive channel
MNIDPAYRLLQPGHVLVNIDTSSLAETLATAGGRILFVVVLALIAAWAVKRAVVPLIRVAVREQMAGKAEIEVDKRISTLSDVIYRTFVFSLFVIVLLTILPEFGINAGPLIAGIGLVGLAIGFGAQNLVRDVINGIEILLENQYGRGDYVKLGAVSGIVVDINLRRTVLRDFEGNVHFVSHGQIEIVSNYSRGYSRVRFKVVVGYGSDVKRVSRIIDDVGRDLAADPVYGPMIREAPHSTGVDGFRDAALDVLVEGVTEPGQQWQVAAAMRLRLKEAMDSAGIKLG